MAYQGGKRGQGNDRVINPPRRILGDHAMHQKSRNLSIFVIPLATRGVKIKPTFLNGFNTLVCRKRS